jgi:tetratricopeptide (TPR) repeat protein
VDGGGAFAPDGRLVAVPTATGTIRLVDPATGRELAALEDPELDANGSLAFAPDGTRLFDCSFGQGKGIRVWDLRLVRRHLAARGLDWEAPPYPPAAGDAAEILKLEVRPGAVGTPALVREQAARQAIEYYRHAVGANPNSATACNGLAWAYLTAPEPLRDVKAAVPLAEKAVQLAPANALYVNTLGVAHYRAGDYRAAVAVLRPNLSRQDDRGLAFDLYFLAMSHHRLGDVARAKDYFDWAVRWRRVQASLTAGQFDELTAFEAEAEELMKPD